MERKPMTDYCELFVFSHTDTLSWALPKTKDNRQKTIRHPNPKSSWNWIPAKLKLTKADPRLHKQHLPWRLQHTLLVSLFRTTPHHDKSWQKKEDGRYVEYNAIGNKPTRGLVIYSLPLCRNRIIAHAALTHLSYPSFNTCYDTFLVPWKSQFE